MTKIGIIREGKIPIDKRVPLTPAQAKEVKERFQNVDIVVQKSDIRCFTDDEYRELGIPVVDNLEDCDIILGVKEVPIDNLLPDKTYFFFSHTIKKQAYNRDLLRTIIDRKIKLVDYETLTDKEGNRIIAFGRWAGIVGAYNGLWTFGKRYNLFHLRRAHECNDFEDLKTEYAKVKLPAIKIALVGGGRVAKGAMEVLFGVGVRRETPAVFLRDKFSYPIFTQLNPRDYHFKKDGTAFKRSTFFTNPQEFEGDFLKYANETDLLIASAYWHPESPVLFQKEDIMKSDFRIKVVSDISCDIDGSVPSTKKATTIDDPVYDYNPSDDKMEKPFSDEGNITQMTVDNLPCELPKDASESFGFELINQVLPALLSNDPDEVIKRATIASEGKLTERFSYLQDYFEGKE